MREFFDSVFILLMPVVRITVAIMIVGAIIGSTTYFSVLYYKAFTAYPILIPVTAFAFLVLWVIIWGK